jgi:beta-galactosidase
MLKPRYMLAFCIVVLTATLCPTVSAQVVDQNDQSVERKVVSPAEIPPLQNVLYGAAYYNEYMPGDQAARLDKDVALMKAAGLNVVRMGESTWSLWEPEDGRYEYAWMDRVVDAMGKAGIKVILGTPTYSIPAWMARKHPEILAQRLNESMYGGSPLQNTYGSSAISLRITKTIPT